MEVIIAEGHGLVSWLIKKSLKSPFSHAAIRYGGDRNFWVIHSTRGGVHPEWWFYFIKKYTNIQRYLCKFPEAEQATDNLTGKIGHKGYDYLGVTGAGIQIILGWLGIKIKNPFVNKDDYHCSEIFPEYFKECNKLNPNLQLKEDWGKHTESVTPPDVLDYLKSRPDLFEKIN